MAKAAAVPLEPTMTFAEAAARVVAARAEELWRHGEGVLDTSDIERVHDMRVATRRLRAVLEIFAPAFPKRRHKAVLRDVKALADALGARRDPDVQLALVAAVREAAGAADRPGLDVLADRLRADQERGNEALAAALEHVERTDLRGRIAALVEAAGR